MAAQAGIAPHLRALEFTYVTFEEGNYWSELNAWLSLVPQCMVVVILTWIVARREIETIFLFTGLGSSTILNSIVKNFTRQPRPALSPRSGYGMPSDHAQFMFFFATYVTLFLKYR